MSSNRPDWMPTDDAGLNDKYQQFAAKFTGVGLPPGSVAVATTLNMTADVAQVSLDAAFLNFVITNTELQRQRTRDNIAFKNALLDGPSSGTAAPYPGPVLLSGLSGSPPGTQPTAVPPGIVERWAKLAARIKLMPGYTVAIGQDLGIVNPVVTPPDLSAVKPELFARQVANRLVVDWKKQRGTDAIRMEVDYGNGTWVPQEDTRPPFEDPHALPPAGQSAVWRVRACYLRDGQMVGMMSDVVSVTMTGI